MTTEATGRVGTTLARKYRLEGLLGVGGMAAVYRAVHRNGHRVALKVLHREVSLSAEIRARFLKEGYVANAIDHPAVVRVVDDDVAEDGSVFIVMDLLDGETLDAHLRRVGGRLPPADVAVLATGILSLLAVAHEKGIIHRDLKPENLFVTTDRKLKVLDFGIARVRDGGAGHAVTSTGRMMGTPAFMPPEQALGLTKEVDPRTDLWALGATMFTLISGRLVHEAETPEQVVVFTATRPARALASVAPETPPALAAVVDRALSFDKTKRFADAREMAAAVRSAYQASFGAPLPDELSWGGQPATINAPTGRPPSAAESAPTLPADHAPYDAHASTIAAGISTMAGTSSEPGGGPTWRRSRRAPIVAGVVGAIALVSVVSISLALIDHSRRTKSAAPTVSVADSAPPPVAASPDPSAPIDHVIASASAPPVVASAPASASPGSMRPSVRRPTPVRPPPSATAAAPDCDPPVFIDPVTGLKKVKPGC